MSLTATLNMAAAGMAREEARQELITENIAHAGVPIKPGDPGYKRKLPVFGEVLSEDGHAQVQLTDIAQIDTQVIKTYDPTHYAADKEGYVSTPNIETLMEFQDAHQSRLSHGHFTQMVKTAAEQERNILSILDN